MTAMDVIASLDEIRAAVNVLEHPFYERWSAGELTARELSVYAGEYRLVVRALAEASRLAADKGGPGQRATLRAHAQEEADHIELWEQFASAAGAAPAAGANGDGELAQTRACARAWTAGERVLEHLAVLYAIEASQARVSEPKREGLCAHWDADARLRARQQLCAEAAALRPESEQRALRERRRQLLALGIEREERARRGLQRVQARDVCDRERVVQPGGPAQSFGVPRVLVARGQHAGRVCSRADADAGADVAEVPRVLEQHDRGGSPVGEQRGNGNRRAL